MSKNNTDQTKRRFLKNSGLASACVFTAFLPIAPLSAKTYMSIDQAKQILLPGSELEPVTVVLSDEQKSLIEKSSKVRVRSNKLNAWKTNNGDWFIVEQIIGKHENIDMAFAFNNNGAVLGMEILTYRESYGHEIRHPKWRAQFHGKDHSEHLKLDRQIKNISGATLSCKHVTDGINRLAKTWDIALKSL